MEVHHPHHPTHKKKWSEYLLEFFMLFVAVTLGFFAENQREHMVEKHREKQYMETLLEDLAKDKEEINQARKYTLNQVNKIDTAMKLISKKDWSQENIIKLYSVNLKTGGNRPSVFTDRTASQLRSGGLRLIENKKVSTLISSYWQLIAAKNAFESTTLEENKRNLRNLSYKIFDQDFYIVNKNKITVGENAKLMTYDLNTLKEYNNRLAHIKFDLKNFLNDYFFDKIDSNIDALTEETKKEYK